MPSSTVIQGLQQMATQQTTASQPLSNWVVPFTNTTVGQSALDAAEQARKDRIQKEIEAARQQRIDRSNRFNASWSADFKSNPNNWKFNSQPDGVGNRGYTWVRNFYGNNGKWYALYESNLGHRTKLYDLGMREWEETKRVIGVQCKSCGAGFTAVIPGIYECPSCKFSDSR